MDCPKCGEGDFDVISLSYHLETRGECQGRVWDIAEQARIAQASYDARPDWVKRISYFAGTNTVCGSCGEASCKCNTRLGVFTDSTEAK